MVYRVALWAVGGINSCAARALILRPDTEIVGALVYTESKAGRDVGELIGMDPIGVRTTMDRDEILALDADVVLHAPLGLPWPMEEHDRDVEALLRSGKNVISTTGYHSPPLQGPEHVDRLERACQDGGATLHGSGVDPDLVLNRLPATLSSMSAEITRIEMAEVAYIPDHPHATMITETLGIGKAPEDFDMQSGSARYMAGYCPQVLDLLARTLGVTLDRIEPTLDIVLATEELKVASTVVKPGTIVGSHMTFDGIRDGEVFIRHEWFFSVARDLPGFPQPKEAFLHIIDIEGTPAFRAEMEFRVPAVVHHPLEKDSGSYGTAMAAVNAIPGVCAAPPGIFYAPVFGAWNAETAARR